MYGELDLVWTVKFIIAGKIVVYIDFLKVLILKNIIKFWKALWVYFDH